MGYGPLQQLGIDSANPVTVRFDFQEFPLVVQEEFHDGNGLRGTLAHDVSRNVANIRRVLTNPGLAIFEPTAVEWANLLPWILGGTTSGSPTVTYALGETRPSRFCTLDRVTKVFTYNGVAVDKFTIKGSKGNPVTLELDLVGIDETEANSGTFPNLNLDVVNGPFMFASTTFSINSITHQAQDFEIHGDFKIDRERLLNSATLTQANPTDLLLTFKATIPEAVAEDIYGLGPAGTQVVVTCTNANAVMTFTMVKVAAPRHSPRSQGRNEVLQYWEGQAFKSAGARELVTTLNPGP